MDKKDIDLGLYLVTDRSLCRGRDLIYVIEQAVKGGVSTVQLREKTCNDIDFFDLGVQIKNLLKPYNIPLIINDRVDIVAALEAEGIHLGQNDIHPQKARKLLGEKAIIGLSVESIDQVEEANNLDVDYLAISPVFATPTKTDTKIEWGLEGLQKIKKISKHTIVAIGGVNSSNAKNIIRAGADGIAVVSAICSADSPFLSACQLRDILRTACNAG